MSDKQECLSISPVFKIDRAVHGVTSQDSVPLGGRKKEVVIGHGGHREF